MNWIEWFIFLFASGSVMGIYSVIIILIIDESEDNNTEISKLGISYICIGFIVIAFIMVLTIHRWRVQFGL